MSDSVEMSDDPCALNITIDLRHPDAASAWIFTETDKIINLCIIPLISTIGIIGNLAFLFSIYRLQSMQTSLNVFTRHLAVADLVYLISVIYWALADFLMTKTKNDAFGSWAECGIFAIAVHLSYFASLGFITLIAGERYMAISAPLKHRAMNSETRAYKLVAGVWLFGFIIAALYVPQFAFKKLCFIWPDAVEYKSLPITFKACLPYNDYVAIYAQLIAILSFAIALVLNGTLYIKIIIELARPSGLETQMQEKSVKLRNQVTRILVINGIIFFICQMPYRISNIDNLMDNINKVLGNFNSPYNLFSKEVYDTIHNLGISFFILNSSINPYLYVMGSRQYRNAMRDAFKMTFCRCLIDKETKNNIHSADASLKPPYAPHSNGGTVSTVSGNSEDQRL